MTTATTTRSTNLTTASAQWANRPADQRFWTLEEARSSCLDYAGAAEELEVDFGGSALMAGDNGEMLLALPDGRECELTHWSFDQLAKTAGAPTDYLRKLPAELAIQCVENGLDRHFAGRPNMTRAALVHPGADGAPVLRSITSTKYARFWNWKVFDRLIGLRSHGWTVPPARPAGMGDTRARPATAADVLVNRNGGGGLAVNVGDMIAPAGIYASDHDMFAFMVNEDKRLEDGSDGGLSRGFFVSNSEVGAAALRVTLFHYRHVCGNHIVWGAENVIEVSIRHIGEVEGRFTLELAGALNAWADQSAADELARIGRAKQTVLGKTQDEVLDAVFKAFTNRRKYNLPSGLSVKMLAASVDLAVQHETTDGNPFSVWGVANGITRYSQLTPFADERNFLDRAATAVLQLAI